MPRYTTVDNHSNCCGALSLGGMGDHDRHWQRRLEEIQEQVDLFNKNTNWPGMGKVLDIIMTDHQIRTSPNLTAGLQEMGWKLVTRFHNSSGTWCNVLHHRPHNKLHSSPYWMNNKEK